MTMTFSISRMSLLLLVLVPASSSSSAMPKLYLPGASCSGSFEILKVWVAAFEAKYPEVDLSVSSVGSGAAQAALWGDINCEKKPIEGLCPTDESERSDNTYANQTQIQTQPFISTFWGMGGGTFDDEHYVEHASRGLQQLPALGGPILITYSKDVTRDLGATTSQQLNLNFETVAGIFNNTIRRWNHSSIKADNPLLDLPSDMITVVVRSDESDMTQTLTEGIHHANPETWPDEAVGKAPTWPLANLTHSTETLGVCMDTCDLYLDADTSPVNNIQADGQTGIGISLLRRPSSVGYLELGYFSTMTQFVAQAHVSSPTHPTSFVKATADSLKLTMTGLADHLEPERMSLTLVDQDTPLGGYPISRYVYWYIKKMAGEYESCYQAWLVLKFIEWTYTDPLAEEIALGHGWVVPPQSVVEKALFKLREIQCILEKGDDGSGTVAYQSDDSKISVDESSDRIIYVAAYVPVPYRQLLRHKQSYLTSSVRIIGLTLMSVSLFSSILVAFLVWNYQEKPSIRCNQPIFLYILLTGTFVMASSIFFLSFDESNFNASTEEGEPRFLDFACTILPWLISLGYVLVYGTLFMKLWRINRVLQTRPTKINVKQVVWPCITLLGIAIFILTIWTTIDPWRWERNPVDEDEPQGDSYGECSSAHDMVFRLILSFVMLGATVLAGFMAWKTIDVDSQFSESNWIFTTIVLQMQALVVGLPMLTIVERSSADATYMGRVLLIWTITMSTLLLMFVPKLLPILLPDFSRSLSKLTERSELASGKARVFQRRITIFGCPSKK